MGVSEPKKKKKIFKFSFPPPPKWLHLLYRIRVTLKESLLSLYKIMIENDILNLFLGSSI